MNNPPLASGQRTSRLAHLDGLRGLAAFFVAFAHFFMFYDSGFDSGVPQNSPLGFEPWVAGSPLNIFFQGNIMVQIFFVLSGYVLINAFMENRSFLGALIRRYIRLTLPIWVACVFAWSLTMSGLNFMPQVLSVTDFASRGHPVGTFAWVDFGETFSQAFYRVLCKPLDSTWLLSVLWTMSVEFSSSVMLIIFCRVKQSGKINPYNVLLLFTILSWGYFQFFVFCGAWLFLIEKKGFLPQVLSWKIFIPLACLAVLYASYPDSEPSWLYRNLTFKPYPFIDYTSFNPACFVSCDRSALFHGFGALLILFLVIKSARLQGLLGKFVFLGKISFPLYLVHRPLLYATGGIFLHIKKDIDAWSVLLAAVPFIILTLGFSWLMYLFVEKPAIALSKRAGLVVDNFCTTP